jgi:hypothetical protein
MSRRSLALPAAAREAFLASLADGHTVTAACHAAGIGRSTAYEHRHRDEAFALAWHDAYEAGTDRFEQEARRRAIDGTLRPVFYKGEEVGSVREFSDRLLELELKARRPEKYRERYEVQHSGMLVLSAEELRKAREAGMNPDVEAAAALIAALPVIDVENARRLAQLDEERTEGGE